MPWGEMVLGAGLAILTILVFQWFKARPRVSVPSPGQGTRDDVQRLVRDGHKIAAIKVYREVHGASLKEAKEAIDAMGTTG